MNTPARMRMSRTALLPVVLLLVCVIPLATANRWTLIALVLPVAVAAWVLRVGVDVGDAGITVRQVAAQRTVPWTELAGIRVGKRAELWLVTTDGIEVRLPVLKARDLPRLAALSGGRLPALPTPGQARPATAG